MDRDDVFQITRDILVESLGVSPEEVTLESYLIDDLGAESIDFLDIFYQAEAKLDIRVSEDDIAPEFQRPLENEEEWEHDVNRELTAEELEKLRQHLPASTHERIVPGLHVYEITRLFNVESLVNFFTVKLAELETVDPADMKDTDG